MRLDTKFLGFRIVQIIQKFAGSLTSSYVDFFVCIDDEHHFVWEDLTEDTNANPVQLALAFYSGVFSFSGW